MVNSNNRVNMKSQKKTKENVETMPEVKFTVNEELNKYRAPEFEPPKLKGIKEKFSKGIVILR
jgi:hypothetical protein